AVALELLELGQTLRRQIARDNRQRCPQPRAEPLLMLRIEEAEQERDRDAIDPRGLECRDQSIDLVFGERRNDAAVGADALGNLEAAAARDERGRRILEQVIKVGA